MLGCGGRDAAAGPYAAELRDEPTLGAVRPTPPAPPPWPAACLVAPIADLTEDKIPAPVATALSIKGMLNGPDYQIVFSDTPGIMNPSHKLHERMMSTVESSFEDADILLLLMESGDKNLDIKTEEKISKLKSPLIIAINKIDKSEQQKVMDEINLWKQKFTNAAVIPISALEKFNLDSLVIEMVDKLPVNPPFYDKDELTDRNVRFFVSEYIREQILIQFQKEHLRAVPQALSLKKRIFQLIFQLSTS